MVDGAFFSPREKQLCSWRLSQSNEVVRAGKDFPGMISGFQAMEKDTQSPMKTRILLLPGSLGQEG